MRDEGQGTRHRAQGTRHKAQGTRHEDVSRENGGRHADPLHLHTKDKLRSRQGSRTRSWMVGFDKGTVNGGFITHSAARPMIEDGAWFMPP